MVRGGVSREDYAAYLSQLLAVHSALERHLAARRGVDPRVAGVFSPRQLHSERLRADLGVLGGDAAASGLVPATLELVKAIEHAADSTPALLGYFYVLEGSMNGNKFIARALSRGLGLTTASGLSYLDPYGDEQRALWQSFKDAMNGATFSQSEVDRMLAAACEMFRGIGRISAAIGAARLPA
jgi:heme oxygenase